MTQIHIGMTYLKGMTTLKGERERFPEEVNEPDGVLLDLVGNLAYARPDFDHCTLEVL